MKDNKVTFKVLREPSIRDLTKLGSASLEGATEIELIAILASQTLAPAMTPDEIMDLPFTMFKEIEELTSQFRTQIASVFKRV
jgi:hypothetical protein